MKASDLAVKEGLPPKDDYLTIKEACAMLKVSKPTLYEIGRKARPPMKRMISGRTIRIKRSEVNRVAECLTRTMR